MMISVIRLNCTAASSPTSNRVVQDGGAYLRDDTLSTTILYRLMRHWHLLECDGRLKQAAEALARKTNST